MAKNSNTVSPRRIIAVAFVFVGLFWMCFGLGNRSQALIVTGAAVIILAFSARIFSSLRRTPRQWVAGTGYVTEVADLPPDSHYGRCSLQLTVDAPGMPNHSVLVNDPRVPASHWPYPGMELPIEVAADDPAVVRISWRSLPGADDTYDDSGGFGPLPYDADPPRWNDGDEYGYGAGRDRSPHDSGATRDSELDLELDLELDGEYGREREPAPEPVRAPASGLVDFDLDDPPATADGSPLPPELGTMTGHRRRQTAPRKKTAPRGETSQQERPPRQVVEGEIVPRRVPRPRPSPRARPASVPAVLELEPALELEPVPAPAPEPDLAAADAGPEPEPAGSAEPEEPGSEEPEEPGSEEMPELVTTYPAAHPGPAGAINGVGLTLLVTDLHRSIAFYRDRLGFYEVDGGEGNTVLASGGTRLILRATRDLGTVTRRSVYLNLEVADVDAVYRDLKAGGVRFTYAPRPVNRSARLELWAAAFRDPDGHGIALTQWRPASAPVRT